MKFLAVMPCRTYWDSNESNKNSNNIENIVFNMERIPNIFLCLQVYTCPFGSILLSGKPNELL